MVQLRYFASLRETLGLGDEAIALPEAVGTVPTGETPMVWSALARGTG